MLLELAVGDAYGAGFEYADRTTIAAHNDLSGYIQHQRYKMPPGSYTDDTQMSLAIAEAIVSGEPWTRERLADRFVEVFHRDPRTGYSSRFYDFLLKVQNGRQFLEEMEGKSDRSGAAMRATPIGVYPTIAEVKEKCELQASLTHDTLDGRRAAVAAALMTHYFLYDLGAKRDLPQFLEAEETGTWSPPWHGHVGAKGWMSVHAAITAIVENDALSTLLQHCIAYSGDVDTVATVALAAGSCCREMQQDLPAHLIAGLENGPYGRDYLIALNHRLLERGAS